MLWRNHPLYGIQAVHVDTDADAVPRRGAGHREQRGGGLVAASPGDATVTAGDADWACADIAGTATNANPRPPNQNSPTTHRIRGRGPENTANAHRPDWKDSRSLTVHEPGQGIYQVVSRQLACGSTSSRSREPRRKLKDGDTAERVALHRKVNASISIFYPPRPATAGSAGSLRRCT